MNIEQLTCEIQNFIFEKAKDVNIQSINLLKETEIALLKYLQGCQDEYDYEKLLFKIQKLLNNETSKNKNSQ